MIRITKMQKEHIAQIAELETLCFSLPWDAASFESELENPLSDWLVALEGETLAAYVGAQTAGGESDIMNVAVAPSFRRRGIARELMLAMECTLRERNTEAISLEVRESNLPAIRLYESLGFCRVGLRPNYYFKPKENALIYRKEMCHEDTGN